MLIKASTEDENRILEFLSSDSERNTFLIANISNYSLDFESLHVYFIEDHDEIVLVYLVFFTNILFSGNAEYMTKADVNKIVEDHHVQLALGFHEFIEKVAEVPLPGDKFMRFTGNDVSLSDEIEIHQATKDDVDLIYDFLQSMDETKNLYKDKAMIAERIIKNDGQHYFIVDEKGIVAHANTSANSINSVMIGGVGVREDQRRKGLATQLVSFIANQFYSETKSVCSIASAKVFHYFYKDLGFEVLGDWNFYNLGGNL